MLIVIWCEHLRNRVFPKMFPLNSLFEFTEFSDRNICHYCKRAWTCHPATSCVRDQDVTTSPARHVWEIGSLNWAEFMLQWFIRFPEFSEFLFHLGKTPMTNVAYCLPWSQSLSLSHRVVNGPLESQSQYIGGHYAANIHFVSVLIHNMKKVVHIRKETPAYQ